MGWSSYDPRTVARQTAAAAKNDLAEAMMGSDIFILPLWGGKDPLVERGHSPPRKSVNFSIF